MTHPAKNLDARLRGTTRAPRLSPFLVIALLLGSGAGWAGDASEAEADAVRSIWFDPVDDATLADWHVVEGDGTASIHHDATYAERTSLRVEGSSSGDRTRVVGPSVPMDLPVRVGFVLDLPHASGEEVRLVDVDGATMASLHRVGSFLEFGSASGSGSLGIPERLPVTILLTEDHVVARAHTDEITHAALGDRPFDHIEVLVDEGWIEIDHLTIVPEGSGFVDFFQRPQIDGPWDPWTLTTDAPLGRELEARGALGTYFTTSLGGPATLSFEDARLGEHAHTVDLFFRTGPEAATLGVPLLFGIDSDGEPSWSVELYHGRYSELRSVALRTPDGEPVLVLPPTRHVHGAFSTLHVATDPVAGIIEIRVDDAPPVEVALTGLDDLTGLGLGNVGAAETPSTFPGVLRVDGVVAGYR